MSSGVRLNSSFLARSDCSAHIVIIPIVMLYTKTILLNSNASLVEGNTSNGVRNDTAKNNKFVIFVSVE